MPDAPTIYDFPFMQEEDARAQANAMARALRGQQIAGALMSAMAGGQKAAPLIGQTLTHQAGAEQTLGTKLLDTLMQEKAARARMREQEASQGRLFEQQKVMEGLRAEAQARGQQAADQRQAAALAAAERRQTAAMAAAEARAAKAAEVMQKRKEQTLTESQGQAAMFLQQGANNLEQAMQMGRDIFPATGAAGSLESLAWKARQAGFPQAASTKQQARQSLLLAIAEPIVRAESGAAVPESEVRRLALRYIPMPGETEHEQERKLNALVGAIGSVSQKLPEWKAAEFRPFMEKAKAWAASYRGKPTAPSTAETPKARKRYNPQTGEFE